MDYYSPDHHTGMVEFNSLHHPKNRRIKEPEFHGSHESFAVVQSQQYTTIATEFNLSTEAINIVVMLCNIAPTDHRSDSWVYLWLFYGQLRYDP